LLLYCYLWRISFHGSTASFSFFHELKRKIQYTGTASGSSFMLHILSRPLVLYYPPSSPPYLSRKLAAMHGSFLLPRKCLNGKSIQSQLRAHLDHPFQSSDFIPIPALTEQFTELLCSIHVVK
jgi:hypothetical protein